jgi:hypothetical protein
VSTTPLSTSTATLWAVILKPKRDIDIKKEEKAKCEKDLGEREESQVTEMTKRAAEVDG